ncbi:hypothetical protein P3573_13300 [Vibrio parahaemolyticus]|nr:hypothetical protein [Vibrio parahaemolyticus]MDF4969553.1 hypothetical protein [Vibrio parahaemolyticus]MDG2548375.1 hypothetical protein [Vibrio parahaemolyticus]MDG2558394.1 hypothetical protein [Vibrio parahaemolyticus]
MPRKRILYENPEQVLNDLITKARSLQAIYVAQFRALNDYEDFEQHEIITAGIKLFQAHTKIKDITF